MLVTPIIIPAFDTALYAKAVQQLTNQDVGRDLDTRRIDTRTLFGFSELLKETTVIGYEHLLNFTFLVEGDNATVLNLLSNVPLSASSLRNGRATLITGSLLNWKFGILQANELWPFEVRQILNEITLFLEQIGFYFGHKKSLEDKTWLIQK